MSFTDSGDFSNLSFDGSSLPSGDSLTFGGAGSGGGGGGLSSLFGGASTGSVLGAGVAGAGLAYDIFKGNPTDPNQQAIEGQASALQSEGSSLVGQGSGFEQYLTQGTLPPALQAKVEQDTQANKARITQNAAQTGSSADPKQNSALTQDLAGADRSGTIEAGDYEQKLFSAGQQMVTQGIQATGLSSQLYESLYKFDQQQNSDLMGGISSFAAALAKIAPAVIAA
jgi:hypothetical protein